MKRFRCGPLTKENAHSIAQEIINTLKGKIWTVATFSENSWQNKIDIETNNVLYPDWTDGSKDLVKVKVDDEFATLHFQGRGYSYIYLSRLDKRSDYDKKSTPYFVFHGHDEFTIKYQVDTAMRFITFKVQDDIPNDSDEYNKSLLEAHELTVPERVS